jgi:hypothetical protein
MDALSVAESLQARGLEVGIVDGLQDVGREQTYYNGALSFGVRADANIACRFPRGEGFAIRIKSPHGGSAGFVPHEELSAFQFLESLGPTMRITAGLDYTFVYRLQSGQRVLYGDVKGGKLSETSIVESFLAFGRVWAGSRIAVIQEGGTPAPVPQKLAQVLKSVGRLTFDE